MLQTGLATRKHSRKARSEIFGNYGTNGAKLRPSRLPTNPFPDCQMFKRNCVVKYVDSFGVEHAAKVEAESLFEAAVRGLQRLDSSFWTEEDVFDPDVHHGRGS